MYNGENKIGNEKKSIHLFFNINTNNSFLIKIIPGNIKCSSLRDVILFVAKFLSGFKEKLEESIRKLEQKGVDFSDDKKVIVNIDGLTAEVKWEDIHIQKDKGIFFLSITIELNNLDSFLRLIANRVENKVVSECINIAINNSPQDEKFCLVDSIIGWMNRFDIISSIAMYLLCSNSRVKKQIDKYDIRIEDVSVIM